jgi:cation transport ATPase
MIRFAVTIFISAFLLFQVQPLIARFILPWFGGTPAVWTTCMLFFQVLLLAGYGYSHFVTSVLKPRVQSILHISVLLISLVFLPIIPNSSLKPTGEESPTMQILILLGITIGLPYILLSTTGPLIQAWFSRQFPGRSTYR